MKKVQFNRSELHFFEVTSYKIHTLVWKDFIGSSKSLDAKKKISYMFETLTDRHFFVLTSNLRILYFVHPNILPFVK